MKFRDLALAAAAVSLASAPVAAQAAQTSIEAPVSRASDTSADESELGGIGPAFIVIAIAAIGMAVLLLTDDDDDEPVSA